MHTPEATNFELQVYDARGALVLNQTTGISTGNNQVKLDMENLPQGNYHIRATWQQRTKIIKVEEL